MILDALLQTRFPEDKQKFLKSEWRDRYCILEISQGNKYVVNVYKTKKVNPSPDERGTLRQTIVLSPDTVVTSENIINKASPFFQYVFAIDEGGVVFKFSSLQDAQRNAWVSSLNHCIIDLKPQPVLAPVVSNEKPSVDDESKITDQSNFPPPSVSDTSEPNTFVYSAPASVQPGLLFCFNVLLHYLMFMLIRVRRQ
jgi:hypothetical protein